MTFQIIFQKKVKNIFSQCPAVAAFEVSAGNMTFQNAFLQRVTADFMMPVSSPTLYRYVHKAVAEAYVTDGTDSTFRFRMEASDAASMLIPLMTI